MIVTPHLYNIGDFALRYYIADCHFFHDSLNRQMDCRGFANAEEMNNYMIAQWNKKVRWNDEVIILGDFSLGKPTRRMRSWNSSTASCA